MNTDNYDDIINLPHHVSATHPQMPMANRAAQFAPFAALTGHAEALQETARLTDTQIELDDETNEKLNQTLAQLRETMGQHPTIAVTFFEPDARKEGGAYKTLKGHLKAIDDYNQRLMMADGNAIPLHLVAGIDMLL